MSRPGDSQPVELLSSSANETTSGSLPPKDVALLKIKPPSSSAVIDYSSLFKGLQPRGKAASALPLAYISSRRERAGPTSRPQLRSRTRNGQSGIHLLPVEMMLQIVGYLPPYGTVSLALACRSLYRILHDPADKPISEGQLFSNLTAESKTADRFEFLQALERDIPHLRLCHYDQTLHQWPGSKQRMHLRQEEIKCGPKKASSLFRDEYQIAFSDIQMAMNRYLFGAQYGLPLSALEYHSNWQCDLHCDRPLDRHLQHGRKRLCGQKLDITPLICSGHLHLHVCQRLWFPATLKQSLRTEGIDFNDLSPCAHYQGDIVNWSNLNRIVNCRLMRFGSLTSCSVCDRGYRCPLCKTEFVISARDHGVRGVEIILDSWQDLGTGRSLSEFGTKHPWSPDYHGWPVAGALERVPKGARSIVRTAFRTTEGASAIDHPSMEPILHEWMNVPQNQDGKALLENAREAARWMLGISWALKPRLIESFLIPHP